MNIEELIKPIVTEILAQMNKRVLIFISGGTVNAEIILSALSDFGLANYDIVMSEAARKVIDKEFIGKLNGNIVSSMDYIDEAVKNSDMILIPIMTRNTLAKVALGISDNIVTTGIARAIMFNKEIIAVKDSYSPQNNINISEGLTGNIAYNSMLLNYENIIESFGVKFIDSNELKKSMHTRFNNSIANMLNENQNSDRYEEKLLKEELPKEDIKSIKTFDSSIVTVKDINQLYQNGKITIKRGTIITPLARDYIYNNNIKIEFY